MRRAFVIVIDACGAGELPDSAEYGDAGANTLGHVAEASGGLELPVLTRLGLGDIIPPAELYAACAAAREIMTGEHAVGRVIARPFRGAPGAFERTQGRRDMALDTPGRSYLQELQADRVPVHTVGKIGQVFNGVG